MKISVGISVIIGIVIVQFSQASEASETKKDVSPPSTITTVPTTTTTSKTTPTTATVESIEIKNPSGEVLSRREGKQMNLIGPKPRAIRFISNAPRSSPQKKTVHRTVVIPNNIRSKPVLRRRYQMNGNVNPLALSAGHRSHQQKMFSQLSPNYQIKKSQMQQLQQQKQYNHHAHHYPYQHKIYHPQQNSSMHKRHHNFKNSYSPNFLQNYFHGGIKKPISSQLKLSNGLQLGSKKFLPSPQFNGNIIVKPALSDNEESSASASASASASSSSLSSDFQAAASTHSNSFTLNDYKYGQVMKHYPPSYSVYDDTDDITQKPVKYQVYSNGFKQNDSPSISEKPLTLSQQQEEAKKYLNFMSSTDYFLPNKQPDYHIRTDSGYYSGDSTTATTTTTPTLSTENRLNARGNLNFEQQKDTNNKNQINHKYKDAERIEFTENDAIHSSFTSSPKQDDSVVEIRKNYGSSQRYRAALKAGLGATTTLVSEINKRKDTLMKKSVRDEQISKECLNTCLIEETNLSRHSSENIQINFNDRERECYESCIQKYSSD